MACYRSPHGYGVSLCVWTTPGQGLFGAQSALGTVWYHALFYRRLGGLRAASGGRAAHGREGPHPEDREQAHQHAHTNEAVGPSDDLLLQDGTHARFSDWPLYPELFTNPKNRLKKGLWAPG